MLGVANRQRPAAVGLSLLLLAGAPAWAAFTQTAALHPADLPAGARFGSAVAIGQDVLTAGDHVVAAGAYLFSGINGSSSGAVFLFGPDGQALGPGLLGQAGEQLGWSVAFAGRLLLAGAPFARVDGVQCGAVYRFTVGLDGRLTPEGRLLGLPCEAGAEIGTALAVDGDFVAVGARGAHGRSGRVYVSRSGGPFTTLAVESLEGAELGTSVAVDARSSRVVAGAPYANSNGFAAGAVQVFEWDNGSWQSTRLPANPQREDAFGYAVAAGGGLVVVGAPLTDAGTGRDAGAVLVYQQGDGGWTETRRRTGDSAGDQLGVAVATGGGRIVAGARRARGHGAAYLLGPSEQILQAAEPQAGAELGFAVASTADLIVAGAFLEDRGQRRDTGAAYLFEERSVVRPQRVLLEFAAERSAVNEDAGLAAVQVRVTTSDGAPTAESAQADLVLCLAADGCTSTAGSDFTPPVSPLPVPAGRANGSQISVPIQIGNDTVDEADESFTLHLSNPSANADLGRSLHRVSIRDDDSRGIRIEPLEGTTNESGGMAEFTVVLSSQPTAEVDISVSNPRPDEVSVSPATVTFTPTTWSQPQTVTVRGKDDAICDGSQGFQIRFTPDSSNDPAYDSLPAQDRDLVNLDNDGNVVQQLVTEPEPPDLTAIYTVSVRACPGRPDGPGPEVVVELPETSNLAWATADQGVVAMDFAGDAVDWSGSLPAGSPLTITVYAGLDAPGADPLNIQLLPNP